MKTRLLLFLALCAASLNGLIAQISNTETTIMLASSAPLPSQICPWNNVPSSSAGNVYQVYIEFEDGDNFGANKRLPTTGTYNCTVTNTPNSYGANIFIDVPAANFPTVNNTSLMWDLVQTKGVVHLINTTTNTTYHQFWEYDQYRCPALPIYIASFTYTNLSDRIKFDWTAIDESDYLSHYILQKSYNNFHWYDDVLEPANTGQGTHNYTVNANKPGSTYTWYRLKWIGEYGFARTTTSIQVFNTGNTPTNVVCNYANITGPATVCPPQSGVYKLHNAPASGGPYNWSAPGATINGVSQAGLTADISFGSGGNYTVYANSANNSCNKTKYVSAIGTGSLYIQTSGVTYYQSYTRYTLSVNVLPGTNGLDYTWYKNGFSAGAGASKTFNVYQYDECAEILVSLNTACGTVTDDALICYYTPLPPPNPCDPQWPPAKVGPVPANDRLTISLKPICPADPPPSKMAGASDVYTIQLFDIFGNMKLERKNVSLKADVQLDVSRLPTGNYVLYMKNAQNVISQQVRIER